MVHLLLAAIPCCSKFIAIILLIVIFGTIFVDTLANLLTYHDICFLYDSLIFF